MTRNFESDEHALKAGMLAGLLMKHGIAFDIYVDDDGDYTPTISIGCDLGDIIVKVMP